MPETNEARYRQIVEGTLDYAIFSADPDGVITTWNRGAERLFQYPSDEAIGKNLRMIFTPEDQVIGDDERELKMAALEGHVQDNRWHVRRDGSRLWANGILTAMRNEAGTIDGFVKIVRDQTNERRMDESLRASEEQFARVFLGNPAAIAIELRETGAIVLANEALFQLIGYWRSETMGRSGVDLRLWANPGQRKAALAELDAGAKVNCATIDVRTKSGDIRNCAVAVANTQLNANECIIMTFVERED